jgi:membrane peptidoglycan carboxypeptidase
VRRRSFFWRYRRVWFLFGILLFTALAGAAWVLTQVPLPPEAPQAQTTVIYDATGAQLATFHGVENRFPVSLDKVPPVVTAAVVSGEDRKFFVHKGIDPLGIGRALGRRPAQGRGPGWIHHHPAVRQERLRRHRLHPLAQGS